MVDVPKEHTKLFYGPITAISRDPLESIACWGSGLTERRLVTVKPSLVEYDQKSVNQSRESRIDVSSTNPRSQGQKDLPEVGHPR